LRRRQSVHRTGAAGQRDRRYQGGKDLAALAPCSAPATAQFAQREENLKYNFPKYIAAGARIVLGTDAGVSAKYSYGFAEHHEIGMYVRLGLTPAEAIVASTSRPTEVLRIKDTGTLAKGKRADFIVLNANPLENIRNTREIDSVYLYGAKLDREALQAKFKQAVVDRDATKAKDLCRKTTCRIPPLVAKAPSAVKAGVGPFQRSCSTSS
jgi:cytosine/adenosine deaminase-related metal-dependent hydrolase